MRVINTGSCAGSCSVRRATVGRTNVLPSRRRAAIPRAQAADAQVELPALLEVDGMACKSCRLHRLLLRFYAALCARPDATWKMVFLTHRILFTAQNMSNVMLAYNLRTNVRLRPAGLLSGQACCYAYGGTSVAVNVEEPLSCTGNAVYKLWRQSTMKLGTCR